MAVLGGSMVGLPDFLRTGNQIPHQLAGSPNFAISKLPFIPVGFPQQAKGREASNDIDDKAQGKAANQKRNIDGATADTKRGHHGGAND